MEIKVRSLYEPLDVTVEDADGSSTTVHAVVDLSGDGLVELAGVCIKAADKAEAARLLAKKAEEERDVEGTRKALAKVGRIVREALEAAIGEESVAEIRAAASGYRELPDAAYAELLGQVFAAVKEIVMARYEGRMDEKAAHYLAEVYDAQPEPDQGD
ncbi:hypothetical protein [Enterorhabdus sp. P55]|uniref:hypothetical protein n=1 Tax=Enterorhabdus sp. P55 TaxID=2304571 RepID=UPI00136AB629|nr:hypothetical protein [Enterorhabdus sp. P55]NBI31884.1 hypothetical protein [Enterorhabdus sp. P55]